jgi:flagellar biosynthetic protein FliR
VLPEGVLAGFGLYLARTSALVLGAPLIGSVTGFSGYKIGLIAAVALLLYGAGGAPPVHASPVEYGLLALREVLLGLFIAFALHAALLAVRAAGQLVGHEMGFSMATIVDPASGIPSSLMSQVYETLFWLALLAVDGHHWLLRALASSFESAPIGALALGDGLAVFAQSLVADMFVAGISLAAPVMVLLALVSVTLALLARAVPQLNVLELGFGLRILVALGAMLVFAPLLAPAFEGLLEAFAAGLEGALAVAGS